MKKIILTILDGFGYREETHGNAVKMANIPTIKTNNIRISLFRIDFFT